MKDKILVSKWGYSMILTTWVRVIKETPKTLVVQELESRTLTREELMERRLTPAWLQCYTLPTDKIRQKNGEDMKPFRVFSREPKFDPRPEWVGTPFDSNFVHTFREWDTEPEFEDHCD